MFVFHENMLNCGLVWPESTFPLSFSPSQMTPHGLGSTLKNHCHSTQSTAASINATWNWIIQRGRHLLILCRNATEFSGLEVVHHGSMAVSQTILDDNSHSAAFGLYAPRFPMTPWIFSRYYELWMVKDLKDHWETLSLNWLTILSRSLAQSCEPWPILACKD